jgi:hypothetical protein
LTLGLILIHDIKFLLDIHPDFFCDDLHLVAWQQQKYVHIEVWFHPIIPLRAKQVSEANLHSEQGGINFTPFVLSLPYAKKKKLPI